MSTEFFLKEGGIGGDGWIGRGLGGGGFGKR